MHSFVFDDFAAIKMMSKHTNARLCPLVSRNEISKQAFTKYGWLFGGAVTRVEKSDNTTLRNAQTWIQPTSRDPGN